MNFQVQVSKERLDRTLGTLKHALDKRVTLPILQHVLLSVDNQEMTLKATDMELGFEAVIPVEASGTRMVAIPGKKFVDTVRVYPDGILTLEWPDSGNRVWLRAKGYNSEHNVQPGDGFPDLPHPSDELPEVAVPGHVLARALQLGSLSVSRDTTKPALSGVLLHFAPGFLRVVSTDGFRLAVAEVPLGDSCNVEARLIIPKRAVDTLLSCFQAETTVHLRWDERTLFANMPGMKVSARRVIGNYPAYEKVLPSELPKRVIVDREHFLHTLRVVGLKKDEYNKNVRLFFEYPNLRVFFQHPDEGVNQGSLSFSGEEQPLELGFNIDYLLELLERLPGSEVVYQFRDDVGQGIFLSPSIEDMSFRYILMPVKFANPA